jgi:hypothetical protein
MADFNKAEYEKKKLEISVDRAKLNKKDYELKIMEKQMEISRLQEEVVRQDEVVAKCIEELANLANPKDPT